MFVMAVLGNLTYTLSVLFKACCCLLPHPLTASRV